MVPENTPLSLPASSSTTDPSECEFIEETSSYVEEKKQQLRLGQYETFLKILGGMARSLHADDGFQEARVVGGSGFASDGQVSEVKSIDLPKPDHKNLVTFYLVFLIVL